MLSGCHFFLNLTSRFPVKTPARYFVDTDDPTLKFMWGEEQSSPRLDSEGEPGWRRPPGFGARRQATASETVWCQQKNGQTDRLNRREPETDPQKSANGSLRKKLRKHNGAKMVSSTNGAEPTRRSHTER